VVLATLAGCASEPPATGLPASVPDGSRAPARSLDAQAQFEQRQRALAETAAQQRRWADAVWAWDVVLALRPDDTQARDQRAKAQQQADDVAADRKARAQQARQRGDLDAATRLYLEALTQAPADRAAADALREIERQRSRRGNVQGYRVPGLNLVRRPDYGGWALLPERAGAAASRSNAQEHASLMASQGDLDAAIAMLEPLAKPPRADPAVRAQLADLYWRQALRLEAKDRQAAVVALERCLQLAPRHAQAAARLKDLRPAAPAPRQKR
jgi:hypothetical protein